MTERPREEQLTDAAEELARRATEAAREAEDLAVRNRDTEHRAVELAEHLTDADMESAAADTDNYGDQRSADSGATPSGGTDVATGGYGNGPVGP